MAAIGSGMSPISELDPVGQKQGRVSGSSSLEALSEATAVTGTWRIDRE